MPGYCNEIKKKLNPLNYVVSYNPEFIAQGTILRDQANPDMVLIGEGSELAGDILEEIYKKHTLNTPRVCRMSPLEAEITKLSLNCFLTTKIAYANMIGDIVTAVGGNPHTVLDAIGQDSRIGNKYLGYGYGYGGPCFPRDNRALALFAEDNNIEALISVASDKSNAHHLDFQIKNFLKTHNLEDKVEFDFVTYKKESTLLTESQQLAFAVGIAKGGCKVKIKERKEVIKELKKRYNDLFTYEERK
jgi:nucleotide sugar dehydrogenase